MLIFSLCFLFFSTFSIGQAAPAPEKKPEAAITEVVKPESVLPKPDSGVPEIPKPGTDLLKPDSALPEVPKSGTDLLKPETAVPEVPKPAADTLEKKKESAVSEALKPGADLPASKQTVLGLYVTAKQAYDMWKSDPEKIHIIDCRTPEEYVFLGHAAMACNIPSEFMRYKLKEEKGKQEPVMEQNQNFATLVMEKFQPDDTILVMCRSGGRSAKSVNKLAEAGFKNVYNITDGFEGDMVKDPESCFNGKRMKNGWKNSGNPWTYELAPEQVHLQKD